MNHTGPTNRSPSFIFGTLIIGDFERAHALSITNHSGCSLTHPSNTEATINDVATWVPSKPDIFLASSVGQALAPVSNSIGIILQNHHQTIIQSNKFGL